MVKVLKSLKSYSYKLPGEKNPFTGEITRSYDSKVVELVKIAPELKEPYMVETRAIISGDVIEVISYEKPYVKNAKSKINPGGKKGGDKVEKRADNIKQTKQKLRRLINSNCTKKDSFVTFTYAENQQDVKQAKDDFKKFIKRLEYYRRKQGVKENLRYVYVIEFQDKYGRGAVHFHTIFFNIEYIEANKLQEIWSLGWIKINHIKHVDNVGAYVVKYMQKDINGDSRLYGVDLYGRSRGNLQEPQIIEKKEACKLLEMVYSNQLTYTSSFDTDYKGIVTYKQYNVNRTQNKEEIV